MGVLESVPEKLDSERDSHDVSKEEGSSKMIEPQTKQMWTAVDHGKGKIHRQRILRRKILMARNE